MTRKLLVFDSHPVQYRVPIWQYMTRKSPGSVHVAYASDCSVRGFMDKEFGTALKWDEPMLNGYESTVLNCEHGTPLSGWGSLTGDGVKALLEKVKPDAVLLTGLNYKYDAVAYMQAKRMGIPLWLRCETQDFAVPRSPIKAIGRSMIYSTAYKGIDKIFYIGELNKLHYLKSGVSEKKLTPARYFTVDRFAELSQETKEAMRAAQRKAAGIDPNAFVIGFSGKLIEKKNPRIFYDMLDHLPDELRRRTHLYFMGSGELEKELRVRAQQVKEKYGVGSFFSGFVNQTQLPAHYLAMDIMILPSRRMGETWGLVTNEAMQSGAGVIVSDAVGSFKDFQRLERFRVFKEGDAKALADSVLELSRFPRSFDWADPTLANYSVSQTSEAFLTALA